MSQDTQSAPKVERPSAKKRTRVIGFITGIGLVMCVVKLFSIQIIQGPALAEQGKKVRTSASSIQAPRGAIVDADGQVLVDSVETYHLAVNQVNILEYENIDSGGKVVGEGPGEAARLMAPLLDMDAAELGGMMLGDSTYHYIARNVDTETYRNIRRLGIYGIEWEPVYQRVYPNEQAAATVIGSVSADGVGNSGLELMFDEQLTGIPGEESYEIGPTGEVIPGAKVTQVEATPGATLHTTLNIDLQNSVQTDLDEAVTRHEADWGAVVVMDVATSEVLVLADSDQSAPTEGPQTSRAVQMVFEPGSVGKILTMASALEAGVVTPTTTYSVPDRYTTHDGELITDIHPHETYDRTVAGIFTESSNTGTVIIGEQVSNDDRYSMMVDMGLGSTTGIQLPGESAGILSPPSEWVGRDVYTTMFGQRYAITAVQEAALAATIGNGGVWQQPTLVSGWTDGEGRYHEVETAEPKQAMREETAEILVRMMESVTVEEAGTGQGAAIEGYRTALKTGTAEIPGGTVATTAGLIPADNPQLAIAVVLYNPRSGHLSSDSAVPLFQKVSSASVRALAIPGSVGEPDLYPTEPE